MEFELVRDRFGQERKLYKRNCEYCKKEFKTYNIVRNVCSRCASLKRKEAKRLQSYEVFLKYKNYKDTPAAKQLFEEKKAEIDKFLKLEEEWKKCEEPKPKFLSDPEVLKEGEDYKIVTLPDGTEKKALPRECILCGKKFYSSFERKTCTACYKFYGRFAYTINSYEDFLIAFNLKDDAASKEKYIVHMDKTKKFNEIYGEWTLRNVLENPSKYLEEAKRLDNIKQYYRTKSPPAHLRRISATSNLMKEQSSETKSEVPERAGTLWTKEEEETLKKFFSEGVSQREIALRLKRKRGGIESRLKKLGLIE